MSEDQRRAWASALSARARQQRRDRWKRPGPQVTGVRVPPPESGPDWRPDQLLGALHDTPDMTGPVIDCEPIDGTDDDPEEAS